jgi:hypothetical protein
MRPPVTHDQPDFRPREDLAVFAIEEMRGGHNLGRDLDHVRATHGAARQRRVDRHATAESDDVDAFRVPVQQHGQKSEQALRQHVAAGGCVHFAVDRQRPNPGEPLHADDRRRAFLVVFEGSRVERGVHFTRGQIGRVLIDAAGQQLPIPGRQQPDDEQSDDPEARCNPRGAAGHDGCRRCVDARARETDRAADGAQHADGLERRSKTEEGMSANPPPAPANALSVFAV